MKILIDEKIWPALRTRISSELEWLDQQWENHLINLKVYTFQCVDDHYWLQTARRYHLRRKVSLYPGAIQDIIKTEPVHASLKSLEFQAIAKDAVVIVHWDNIESSLWHRLLTEYGTKQNLILVSDSFNSRIGIIAQEEILQTRSSEQCKVLFDQTQDSITEDLWVRIRSFIWEELEGKNSEALKPAKMRTIAQTYKTFCKAYFDTDLRPAVKEASKWIPGLHFVVDENTKLPSNRRSPTWFRIPLEFKCPTSDPCCAIGLKKMNALECVTYLEKLIKSFEDQLAPLQTLKMLPREYFDKMISELKNGAEAAKAAVKGFKEKGPGEDINEISILEETAEETYAESNKCRDLFFDIYTNSGVHDAFLRLALARGMAGTLAWVALVNRDALVNDETLQLDDFFKSEKKPPQTASDHDKFELKSPRELSLMIATRH